MIKNKGIGDVLDLSDVGITIMAYSRPDHLEVLLSSLKDKGIYQFSVFIDGADNREIRSKQDKIIELLENISWANVSIVRRSVNLGLRRSIVSAITEQFKKYEKVILIEDDCIPQELFFDFMLESLNIYDENKTIRSVCGYQLPTISKNDSECIDGILSSRFIPWGWATWRDRWSEYETDLDHLCEELHRHGIYYTLPGDIKKYIDRHAITNDKNDIWSINWVLSHYLTNTYSVFPSKSLVDNIGFDGSGVHCTLNDAFDIEPKPNFNCTKLYLDKDIVIDHILDRKIIDYMEKEWGGTMTSAIQNNINLSSNSMIGETVLRVINETPIIDMHTHLFPCKTFNSLSGIDNLLTYHYLVAEALSLTKANPAKFYSLSISEQANFIWDVLFVEKTPISEACHGVLTILNHLNIAASGCSYLNLKRSFDSISYNDEYIFKEAGVDKIVMTNDPFNKNEWKLFDMEWDRDRYLSSIRIDQLFINQDIRSIFFEKNTAKINLHKLYEYLSNRLHESNAVYLALSIDGDDMKKFINDPLMMDGLLAWTRKSKLPICLMVGVKRGVNPEYAQGGDGIGGNGLHDIEILVRSNPDQLFFITHLDVNSQHALVVLSRKFSNLKLFGFWWFVNLPSLVESNLNLRLDLIGTDFVAQHSDARVHEQLIYKWSGFKDILHRVMTSRYEKQQNVGFLINDDLIKHDIKMLLNTNFMNSISLMNNNVNLKQ